MMWLICLTSHVGTFSCNLAGLLAIGYQQFGDPDKLEENPLQHLFEVKGGFVSQRSTHKTIKMTCMPSTDPV